MNKCFTNYFLSAPRIFQFIVMYYPNVLNMSSINLIIQNIDVMLNEIYTSFDYYEERLNTIRSD